jgi:hypothetical protein
MAVSHATFVAASSALSSMVDVERLSRDASLGLSYEALLSILARKVEHDIKRDVPAHRRPEVATTYVKRYLNGESLLDLARATSLPPTMLARIVLEAHLGLKKGKEVGQLIRSPHLLDDARLQQQVEQCVDGDPFCGPHVDTVRRLVGLEYEDRLAQKLRAIGVPFLTEDELRLRGDAKTPDALLPVPLLVRGRAVHWIDSKATFGDPQSHADYRLNQFASYLHRYDSGLVLYWHGFDESIDTDHKILLLDDLRADECELMTCCLNGATPSPRADSVAAQSSAAQPPTFASLG